jgi:hypothetical protein
MKLAPVMVSVMVSVLVSLAARMAERRRAGTLMLRGIRRE